VYIREETYSELTMSANVDEGLEKSDGRKTSTLERNEPSSETSNG